MSKKKKLVVFTGAGISAESGLKTFRDSDGLWEEYNVMEVATPEAWDRNPKLVLEFYNKRREQIVQAQPNKGHLSIAGLEKKFDVTIITQNIDNLHEKAGSQNVLHLHGNVMFARSTNPLDSKLYPVKKNGLHYGDCCPSGYQLRPHVVWFGEEVPNMQLAQEIVSKAEILLVVGTSLTVYPAANLLFYSSYKTVKFLVDPSTPRVTDVENLSIIKEKASDGLPLLAEKLLKEF